MTDSRHDALSRLLVGYSIDLKAGESCLIQAVDVPVEMVESLVSAVYEAGGTPFVKLTHERLQKVMLAGAGQEDFTRWTDCDAYQMERMDAFIGIRGYINPRETALIDGGKQAEYAKAYYQPVHHQIRVPKTKWVVLRYPTPAMAYMADMPSVEFEEFYYQVTSGVDYAAMSRAMAEAAQFLDKADRVHILGPGTDVKFSIRSMGSVPCDGRRNIPDGEIYTAPVKESVEGKITYNTPSTYQGVSYRDISFEFSSGKIVRAEGSQSRRLNAVLDTDEGARYIGEFALGCNPRITRPMDEILFDEKIAGSFHFTPGAAYQECDNGNRSSVHWDLVSIQSAEYGGGEIWIDGNLIRKDGIFLHEAFLGLNPDQLT